MQIPDFSRVRLLVVGDLILDKYYHGHCSRLSPEAPVPVVDVERLEQRPGGAANVAMNLCALGATVHLAGATGSDAAAATLRESLDSAGVRCTLHEVPGASIVKTRVLGNRQQLVRLDFERRFAAADAAALAGRAAELVEGCDSLLLSDYAKGTLADPQPWIGAARARKMRVFIDPKGSDWQRYRGASCITPNLGEFRAVVGPWDGEAAMLNLAHNLVRELGLEALVITRSEQGMSLVLADGSHRHSPAIAREVADVTGAGDSFVATLTAAAAAGLDLPAAASLANRAASLAVGRLGAAAISAAELAERGDSGGGAPGILSPEQLQNAVHQARARGQKIVFTNGCFDILHAGHVAYLKEARALGDRLIVAVNDDAGIRRLKGQGRPINPLARRQAVLAGLRVVDWVTHFDEDTPEGLLRTIKPDTLVKGGDYSRREDVVGWQTVEQYGGQVRILSLVDNCSTTAILNRSPKP